jgi:hypothetical protein
VAQWDWEAREAEELPFLMVVQPQVQVSDDGERQVRARMRFLVPSFEVERTRLLGMPFNEQQEGEVASVPWEEHWDPYTVSVGER